MTLHFLSRSCSSVKIGPKGLGRSIASPVNVQLHRPRMREAILKRYLTLAYASKRFIFDRARVDCISIVFGGFRPS